MHLIAWDNRELGGRVCSGLREDGDSDTTSTGGRGRPGLRKPDRYIGGTAGGATTGVMMRSRKRGTGKIAARERAQPLAILLSKFPGIVVVGGCAG